MARNRKDRPTPKDRERAEEALYFEGARTHEGNVEAVAQAIAQTRREWLRRGREEGIREAARELQILGNTKGAAQLQVRLLDQPAPEGEKP